MAELNLGEMLEQILNRMVADLKAQGAELSYTVNAGVSKKGMQATVRLRVTPKKVEADNG